MARRVRAASTQQELPFGVRVRRGKQRLSRDLKPILVVGGILVGGLLLYVWQHVQVVRLSYQLEQLRAARITLVQEGKALKVELGRLRSVKRVEEMARRKLGMVNPVPGQVIFLEEPR